VGHPDMGGAGRAPAFVMPAILAALLDHVSSATEDGLLSREHLPWWHTALALPLAVGHKIHLQIGYYDERKFTRTVRDWAGLVARDLACIHPEPP